MDVPVDRSRAGDTRPSGAQTAPVLDELALQDEQELRTLVSMRWESRSRVEPDDLHLPAVGDGDVPHEDPGRHRRWPPGQVIDLNRAERTARECAHGLPWNGVNGNS